MTPPFDTGKVKIGIAYEPPLRNYMSRDAERLQAALLKQAREADAPLPLRPDWIWVITSLALLCLPLSVLTFFIKA